MSMATTQLDPRLQEFFELIKGQMPSNVQSPQDDLQQLLAQQMNAFDLQRFGMETAEIEDIAQELRLPPQNVRQRLGQGPVGRFQLARDLQIRQQAQIKQRLKAVEDALGPRERIELAQINRHLTDLRFDPAMQGAEGGMASEAQEAVDELLQRKNMILQQATPPPSIQDQFGAETVQMGDAIFARNPRGWQRLMTPGDAAPKAPTGGTNGEGPISLGDFNKIVDVIQKQKSQQAKSPYPVEKARLDAVEQIRFYEKMTGRRMLPESTLSQDQPQPERQRSPIRRRYVDTGPSQHDQAVNQRASEIRGIAMRESDPQSPQSWSLTSLRQAAPVADDLRTELLRRFPNPADMTPEARQEFDFFQQILDLSGGREALQQDVSQAAESLMRVAGGQAAPANPETWEPDLVVSTVDDARRLKRAAIEFNRQTGQRLPGLDDALNVANKVIRFSERMQGPTTGPAFEAGRRLDELLKNRDAADLTRPELQELMGKAGVVSGDLLRQWGDPKLMPQPVRERYAQVQNVLAQAKKRALAGQRIEFAGREVDRLIGQHGATFETWDDYDLILAKPYAEIELIEVKRRTKGETPNQQDVVRQEQLEDLIKAAKDKQSAAGELAEQQQELRRTLKKKPEDLTDVELANARQAAQDLENKGQATEETQGINRQFEERARIETEKRSEERNTESYRQSVKQKLLDFTRDFPSGEISDISSRGTVLSLVSEARFIKADIAERYPDGQVPDEEFEVWQAATAVLEAAEKFDPQRFSLPPAPGPMRPRFGG